MIGFHANYFDECNKFINIKGYLIWSEDRDYLGPGMYFWEHLSNARYWLKTKKNDRQSSIVSANIAHNKVLDLTDDDVCAAVTKSLKKIAKTHDLFNNNNDFPFGIKLGYLFESFSYIRESFNVVKAREKKNKRESLLLEKTPFTTNSIDIFCVKTADALSDRKWVYENE